MKGTVTISLLDYEQLRGAKADADRIEYNVKLLAKELQVFLTFICTRSDIEKYVQDFNLQSTTSKIILEGGRSRIEKR